MTWPHPGGDWGGQLAAAYAASADIGAVITRHQALLSVCRSPQHAKSVGQMLRRSGADMARALFCIADSNDCWTRDHGPLTTLAGNRPVLNDFGFDGWGGRFAGALDTAITGRLYRQKVFGGASIRPQDLVLEGGAVETDGCGTLLATRSSILSRRRNPDQEPARIERSLRDSLGFERILWLDHGQLSGDDTDGHVDTLARFATPDTILYSTAPAGDDDHPPLAAMHRQLRGFRTLDGRPYQLRALPFPGVHRGADGRRLPASYANFLIINRAVLAPTYGVSQDQEAIAVFKQAFPDREIHAVDCRPLIQQNGSVHCLTMQLPQQVRLRGSLETPIP